MDQSIRLPAALASLAKFQAFAAAHAARAGASQEKLGHIALVLEEVLVNIIKYAYPESGGMIELCATLDHQAGMLHLRALDTGRPFNPLASPQPDTAAAVEDRPIGGLGILLVKRLTDAASYARQGEANVLSLGFKAPGAD